VDRAIAADHGRQVEECVARRVGFAIGRMPAINVPRRDEPHGSSTIHAISAAALQVVDRTRGQRGEYVHPIRRRNSPWLTVDGFLCWPQWVVTHPRLTQRRVSANFETVRMTVRSRSRVESVCHDGCSPEIDLGVSSGAAVAPSAHCDPLIQSSRGEGGQAAGRQCRRHRGTPATSCIMTATIRRAIYRLLQLRS
jgi:hypothetical protein